MYKPVFLKTENQLNKILKAQKKTGDKVSVLFTSLWDDHSQTLVQKLKKWKGHTPLYVVDSFTMPHAFVIFKTSKVPHLVSMKRNVVESEDYLSMIYKTLGV
tara:strand:- start:28675 stop:28980 length:306 start_codon:yes stop_codon:yes gene_type:complete